MMQVSIAAQGSTAEVAGTLTPPGSGTFTAIHFVLIAILALVTLLVIAAGIRRKRARKDAERRVEREAAEAGLPPPPPAPGPSEARAAPLAPQSLDRSATAYAPAPPTRDDPASPRPVAPGPEAAEPVRDEAPPARPLDDEPVAAAAPLDASPATLADPEPATVAPSPADGSVSQLKGVGPKVAQRLAEQGITTVGQVAALDADQAQRLDARLGPFAGRLHRDRWVEQARFLAAGDRAGFEAVFGRL